jgi:hypothetical protein
MPSIFQSEEVQTNVEAVYREFSGIAADAQSNTRPFPAALLWGGAFSSGAQGDYLLY